MTSTSRVKKQDMQRSENDATFCIVEYEGPKLSQDPAVRRLIRQRAMKDVARARRQRGGYGKHNMRQLPLFVERTETVPRSPGSYVGMAMSPDSILLLQMIPLTGLRLGTEPYYHPQISARADLGEDIFSSSYLGSRKLLSYIPSRYGKAPSLSHATDCVVTKLRQMITHPDHRHPNDGAVILEHYNKALRALQADLSDKNQWVKPETLCAAKLLGAFEVLPAVNIAQVFL